jgi:transcriptional regulator GlxA family with amidase domain
MPREGKETKTIAFVTYPGLTLLDLVGPITTFYGLTRGLLSTSRLYRTVSVAEHVEPLDSNTPMALIPEKAFEEVPAPFAIIVPGGGVNALKAMGNERIVDYLRFAAHGAEIVGSVSTGAFLLAAAGLLEGRQATTHPSYGELLQRLGANYVRRNWVEDGKFICSAGVSAGIDMALQLAARLTDEQKSREVQYRLGYDPEPPFGGIDFEHIGGQLGAARAVVSLAAPVIAAKPMRLTRQGR